jgi:hypothetical protein
MLRASAARPDRRVTSAGARMTRARLRLLTVALQDLGASRRKLLAIFLQAGKDGEVALIHHGTAMPLHVAGASFLLVYRAAMLREGRGGERE